MDKRSAPPGSESSPKNHLARVWRNDDGSFVIHDLEEHLRAVGKVSGEFAASFGQAEWGYLAGLWHDLGKYSSAFQSYIARESGFDPEAYIEGGKGQPSSSIAGVVDVVRIVELI